MSKYDQLKHQLEQLRPLIEQYRQQAKPLLIAYRARAQRQRLYYAAPILAAYIAYKLYKRITESKVDPQGKVVVISGCDTGFGHGAAIALDQLGYTVFAGCLQDKFQQQLKQKLSSRSHTFQLDITKQESIDKAYDLVKSKCGGSIHALINNAGVGWGGLVDWEPMEKLRLMMEINFFGHASMTKKFFDLVTNEPDGRIVNLCSVAGYLATAGMSAYSSSKFALEAFSDSLRREVKMWDTHVSIVEPGFMKTAIIERQDSMLQEVFQKLDEVKKERYGHGFVNKMEGKGASALIKLAEDPKVVVNDIVHAVTSKHPHIRYRSGWFSSRVAFPASTLPAGVMDAIMGRDLAALRPAAYRG